MEKEVIEVVDADITDIAQTGSSGSLLDSNPDNILIMANKAEQYLDAMNRIMTAALKITNELDWTNISGKFYLQETGATKVARLFGITIHLLGDCQVDTDFEGYKTYTYRARFILKDQYIEAEGSRSMRDDFFAKQGKDKPLKKPDEIDWRDVKQAAYTNCVNNGIKRLIPGLRNITKETLAEAGLDISKINGYTHKTGSKGGNSGKAEDSGIVCEVCGKPITQRVASFSQSKYGKCLCMDCQNQA